MYIFITVNYNSSDLIIPWAESIRKQCCNSKLLVIDNFYNDIERMKVIDVTKELNILLIESENDGYGAALNRGIAYAMENFVTENSVFFAGNLDICYKNIPNTVPSGKYAYVPIVREGKRNRNPFLTTLQKNILPVY